jgi:hypothetical protein
MTAEIFTAPSTTTRRIPVNATATAIPDRTMYQRLEALKLANAIRSERADIKRDIKAGRISFEQILLDPPECVHSAKLADIMVMTPRWGRVKVAKALQRCRISPSKTMIGLSDRQRRELLTFLHGRYLPGVH